MSRQAEREVTPSQHGDPRTLWAAVILQAKEDYRTGSLEWSYFGTHAFRSVCKLAGVNWRVCRAAIRHAVAPKKASLKLQERRIARRAKLEAQYA